MSVIHMQTYKNMNTGIGFAVLTRIFLVLLFSRTHSKRQTRNSRPLAIGVYGVALSISAPRSIFIRFVRKLEVKKRVRERRSHWNWTAYAYQKAQIVSNGYSACHRRTHPRVILQVAILDRIYKWEALSTDSQVRVASTHFERILTPQAQYIYNKIGVPCRTEWIWRHSDSRCSH